MESAARTWTLPDEPTPVRLMNTIWADARGVHDHLQSPADVGAWLDAVGIDLLGAVATPEDLARARALRDAARRLAAYVSADSREAAASATESIHVALAVVNAAVLERPAPRLELRDGRLQSTARARVSPVRAGIAQVAEGTVQLLCGSTGDGLRACHAPGCVLYFVKTHPRREWCSVACGNRARAARHYDRVRSGPCSRVPGGEPENRSQ
jgi:predicted RNA-binding Zn ribbon-like protein